MLDEFFVENPELVSIKEDVKNVCLKLCFAYENDNKLLICGNGGSCSDADHIVAELMKGFLKKRPLSKEEKKSFSDLYGNEGNLIAEKLQKSLTAIALNNHSALNTAFANDVDPELVYAQQVMGYGKKNDVLLAISTSGNAKNTISAIKTAKVKNMITIGLTGKDAGEFKGLCDICIIAPSNETYKIQEYHVKIYHLICAVVEAHFFQV